jgi:hypothetical protein
MQIGAKQRHPNLDAELNVMTKLCEELDDYVTGLRCSNNSTIHDHPRNWESVDKPRSKVS